MKAVYRPSSTSPSLAVGFCKQPSLIRAWATAPRPQKSAEFAASLLPSPLLAWRVAPAFPLVGPLVALFDVGLSAMATTGRSAGPFTEDTGISRRPSIDCISTWSYGRFLVGLFGVPALHRRHDHRSRLGAAWSIYKTIASNIIDPAAAA
jgi:hypothetical protein